MIALQNMDQLAGNNWSTPSHPMMHEIISVNPEHDVDFSYANSIFDRLEQQMRDGEAEFSDGLKALREKYVFNNVGAVEHFVKTHRMVAPFLIEAAPQLTAAFGRQTPLVLEVMPDDEIPHSIYALAVWDGNVIEAREALRRFDEQWLSLNFQAINGRIVFDYELI